MSRVELAPEVQDNFDRILDHLAEYEVEDLAARITEIIQAISILEHSPLVGRPAQNGKWELVIGRGSHGDVALYRYVSQVDTVFVLGLRSQREAGYSWE
ncbi:MAG: type II toxin-antitoxin system RelE/ParE family toxin [Thiobacillaceae bacterium]